MKVSALSETDKKRFDADVMVTLDFNDLAAQGAVDTGSAVSILPGTTNGLIPAAGVTGTDTFPAGMKVALVGLVQDIPFLAPEATGLTIQVGDGGSTNRFLTGTSLSLINSVGQGFTPTYDAGIRANQPYVYTVADTVDALFVSTGVDPGTYHLNSYTAGKVRLYFKYENLNRLPKI